jgi:hypothetical protein
MPIIMYGAKHGRGPKQILAHGDRDKIFKKYRKKNQKRQQKMIQMKENLKINTLKDNLIKNRIKWYTHLKNE